MGSPSILQKLSYVNTQKLDLTNQLGKSQKDTKRYKSRQRKKVRARERERERERVRSAFMNENLITSLPEVTHNL